MDSLKEQNEQNKGPNQPLSLNTSFVKILPCNTAKLRFLS
jgi:hypothetical protein